MSLHRSDERNESLNALIAAILQGAHRLTRGLSLDLIVARPDGDNDDDQNSVSTHVDYCRPQLTIAESA